MLFIKGGSSQSARASSSLINKISIIVILIGLLYLFKDNLISLFKGVGIGDITSSTADSGKGTKRALISTPEIEKISIGVINSFEGDVIIVRKDAGGPKEYRPVVNGFVLESDLIKTGRGGKIQIVFNNDSTTYIGERSRVELSYYGVNRGYLKQIVSLVSGKIRTFVTKSARKRDVRVVNKNVVMGVRGTDFVVVFNDKSDTTTVFTFEGSVNLVKVPANTDIRAVKDLGRHDDLFRYSTKLTPNRHIVYKPPKVKDKKLPKITKIKELVKRTHGLNKKKPFKPKKFNVAKIKHTLRDIHKENITPKKDVKRYQRRRKKRTMDSESLRDDSPKRRPKGKAAPRKFKKIKDLEKYKSGPGAAYKPKKSKNLKGGVYKPKKKPSKPVDKNFNMNIRE